MFQNLDKRQKYGSIMAAALVLFVLGVIGSSYMHSPQAFKIEQQGYVAAPSVATVPQTLSVTGEVVNPGEITFAAGTTVGEAIELAGGVTSDADLTQLDLSAILDGSDLSVPKRKLPEKETSYMKNPPTEKKLEPNSISINEASAEELDRLPYIGPARAKAIIEYREKIGRFKALEELKGVDGIGDGIYDKISPYIKL